MNDMEEKERQELIKVIEKGGVNIQYRTFV